MLLIVTLLLFVFSLVKFVFAVRSGLALSEMVIPFVMVAVIAEQIVPRHAGWPASVLSSVKLCSFLIALILFVVSSWKGH
jgi:hypothetical protein